MSEIFKSPWLPDEAELRGRARRGEYWRLAFTTYWSAYFTWKLSDLLSEPSWDAWELGIVCLTPVVAALWLWAAKSAFGVWREKNG